MKRFNKLCVLYASFFSVVLLVLSGCATPYNITYFQDMPLEQEVTIAKPQAVVLQEGDEISILVSTRDAALSSLFSLYSNYSVGNSSGGSTSTNTRRDSYYVVGNDGCIDFPVLGRIPVAGKTRIELEQFIKKMIQDQNLVKDPVVTVNYNNLFVNIIGSAGHVGRVNIDRDNFTLIDAMAQSGDLQLTGLRENVRVIREVGMDKRIAYEVNFCSAEDVYNSPVFYLQQNDVIYIEPNNKVKRTTTQYGSQMVNYTFWVGIITSIFSLIALFK
jgi:polysaccharide export outer membrane protein